MHQTRVAVFIHATWATWDRLPLLSGEIEQAVYRAIGAKCAELGVDLVALGGADDHVHMLIRQPASITLAELIGQVKGVSAHRITHQIAPGEYFKWQGGYGAFSVSARNLQQACDYINNQREHHRIGKTVAAFEPLDKQGIREDAADSYIF